MSIQVTKQKIYAWQLKVREKYFRFTNLSLVKKNASHVEKENIAFKGIFKGIINEYSRE